MLAHIREDGEEQNLNSHLQGTAELARSFAAAFGAGDWGYAAGLLHDIGKSSAEFQQRICGGTQRVDHSTPGAKAAYDMKLMPLAYAIAGHHGGLPDGGNSKLSQAEESSLAGRLKRKELPELGMPLPPLPKLQNPFQPRNNAEVSFLTRMLYSCLVDADFLDTEHFMQAGQVERGGYENLQQLYEKLCRHIEKWGKPQNELNQKRSEILNRALSQGEKPRGLYTMSVPTGGGKTTASLAFALKHALEQELERIIYVIPYTSIIEQNAKVFADILGEENVLQHHSNVDWESSEKESGLYPAKHQLATENWDAPLIVTTAVQFFESLYAAKPSRCRKLHNIANSVIIFDEAQTLPPDYLRPCLFAMAELLRHYRASILLCTATQPALEGFFREYAPEYDLEEICPGADGECFRRCSLHRWPEREDKDATSRACTAEELAEALHAEEQALCILNTKAAAQKVFSLCRQPGSYHLSTLMTAENRSRVLKEIRQRLNEGKSCRVVSTSLLEAGVDVDFPRVYREEAGLDSILQAAGRCNREGKRPPEESLVYIFRLEGSKAMQFGQQISMLREIEPHFPDLSSNEAIHAYFEALFSLKGDQLDKKEIMKAFEKGIKGCAFPFRQVAAKIHLVEDSGIPLLIPCKENEEDLQLLREGHCSRGLLRRLGKHTVNVYPWQLSALQKRGAAQRLSDELDFYLLLDKKLYQEDIGLFLEIPHGDAWFVE
ncbi:MAG: CRISPR-associated helicase Cas3' [Bacillota bacterium]|nr:CRISPR-associated helicase Cas3' [Bacillota bacterium]